MNTEVKKILVVVHSRAWQTPKGESLKSPEYHVYAGSNPFGPRGGRGCNVVDGECVNRNRGVGLNGRFSRRETAVRWAKEYAERHGYEYFSRDEAQAAATQQVK